LFFCDWLRSGLVFWRWHVGKGVFIVIQVELSLSLRPTALADGGGLVVDAGFFAKGFDAVFCCWLELAGVPGVVWRSRCMMCGAPAFL
jgi:hypothetical protein